jgi:hypothetical protein
MYVYMKPIPKSNVGGRPEVCKYILTNNLKYSKNGMG